MYTPFTVLSFTFLLFLCRKLVGFDFELLILQTWGELQLKARKLEELVEEVKNRTSNNEDRKGKTVVEEVDSMPECTKGGRVTPNQETLDAM